jgi:hypothetical protein
LAITVAISDRDQRELTSRIIRMTFDDSYPAGGEALTGADLGLETLQFVIAEPVAGYVFQYNYSTQKLMAFVATAIYAATKDAASMLTVTAADESLTFTGVAATDRIVSIVPPAALAAGIEIQSARVASANTVTARTNNPTGGTIDPASGSYSVFVTAANGAMREVPATTDLSAVTTRILAVGR